jgi:hypothetical protein
MSQQIMTVTRNAITKIVNKFGNTITISNLGTETYDTWGEPTVTGRTTVSTVGVFDQYIAKQLTKIAAGLLADGQVVVILKYSETIDVNYLITYDSVDYRVLRVNPIKEANVLVAYEVLVERVI